MGPVYAAVDRVISRQVFMVAFRDLQCSVAPVWFRWRIRSNSRGSVMNSVYLARPMRVSDMVTH